jgi:hypothetical protein
MKKQIIVDVIGWCGAAAILLAYALLSFGFIIPNGFIYQILNATGSLCIAYISLQKKVFQPGVLNIIWMIVAVVSIVRLLI